MEITSIEKNKHNKDRFSVYIDGKYSFAISDNKLIELKIATGDKLDERGLDKLQKAANDDKIYAQTLRYVSLRLKTNWQVEQYLKKKGASPALITNILNKLSELNLVNDLTFSAAYIRERQSTLPASKRKISYELAKKHVPKDIVEESLEASNYDELASLKQIILKKRSKYTDRLKLMQYLSRQGFNYGDIKQALEDD